MDFEKVDASFGNYAGSTTGQMVEDRWSYPGIGYNASDGIFYVGEGDERKALSIVPFALRQCKEVTDLTGSIRRYPYRTRRVEMIEGDIVQRVQVAGLVDGELHIFGARSWTARAAWLNPRSGPYHDERFEAGIWYRLQDYIKSVKADKGISTAPLCYELALETGEAIDLTAAANTKQKAKGTPIVARSLKFVGEEQAKANEALFTAEALDEWVAEWNKSAVGEPAQAVEEPVPGFAETEPDGLPF